MVLKYHWCVCKFILIEGLIEENLFSQTPTYTHEANGVLVWEGAAFSKFKTEKAQKLAPLTCKATAVKQTSITLLFYTATIVAW